MGTGETGEPEKAPGAAFSVGNVNGSDTSSCDPAELGEMAVDVVGGMLASEKAGRDSDEAVLDEGEVGRAVEVGVDPEPFDFDRNRGGLRIGSGDGLGPAPSQSHGPGAFWTCWIEGELTKLETELEEARGNGEDEELA